MKTAIHACFIVGLVSLVLANGMMRGENSIRRFFELRKSEDIMNSRVTELKDENRKLLEEIKKIKQSPEYARRILRDKYHVTEDGERIQFFED